MTRLEKAQQVLKERLVNIGEVTYERPRGEIKQEILSDIFYEVFDCEPTKLEQKWLDKENASYQNWLATEFM